MTKYYVPDPIQDCTETETETDTETEVDTTDLCYVPTKVNYTAVGLSCRTLKLVEDKLMIEFDLIKEPRQTAFNITIEWEARQWDGNEWEILENDK